MAGRFDLGTALGFTTPKLDTGPPLSLAPGLSSSPPPVAPTLTDQYQASRPVPLPLLPPPVAAPAAPGAPGISPDIRRRAMAADVAERAANAAEAAALKKRDVTQATGELGAAGEYRQRLGVDEEARARTAAEITDRRRSLYNELNEIGQTRINENQLYQDASTGQRIAGAIAIGLGGFLAGPKGQNTALALIERQIDANVKAQMANLENRRGIAAQKQSLLGQIMAQGRDEQEARHLLTLSMYDAAKKEVDAQAKMAGTDLAAAQAQKLNAGIDQRAAARDYAYNQDAYGNALKAHSAKIQDEQLELARQREAREAAKDQLDYQLALQKGKAAAPYEPGKPGDPQAIFSVSNDLNGPVRAAKPEVADDVNKKVTAATEVLRLIDRNAEIRRRISGGGFGLLPGEDKKLRDEAEGNYQTLVKAISNAEGQGIVRKEDYEEAAKRLGDPTAWYDTQARMEATRRHITSMINSEIEGRTGHKLKARWGERLKSEIPGGTLDVSQQVMPWRGATLTPSPAPTAFPELQYDESRIRR